MIKARDKKSKIDAQKRKKKWLQVILIKHKLTKYYHIQKNFKKSAFSMKERRNNKREAHEKACERNTKMIKKKDKKKDHKSRRDKTHTKRIEQIKDR